MKSDSNCRILLLVLAHGRFQNASTGLATVPLALSTHRALDSTLELLSSCFSGLGTRYTLLKRLGIKAQYQITVILVFFDH